MTTFHSLGKRIIDDIRGTKLEPKNDEELQKTLPYLRLQLKALIARDIWDMSEYFSIMNEENPTVKKALEVIME